MSGTQAMPTLEKKKKKEKKEMDPSIVLFVNLPNLLSLLP